MSEAKKYDLSGYWNQGELPSALSELLNDHVADNVVMALGSQMDELLPNLEIEGGRISIKVIGDDKPDEILADGSRRSDVFMRTFSLSDLADESDWPLEEVAAALELEAARIRSILNPKAKS